MQRTQKTYTLPNIPPWTILFDTRENAEAADHLFRQAFPAIQVYTKTLVQANSVPGQNLENLEPALTADEAAFFAGLMQEATCYRYHRTPKGWQIKDTKEARRIFHWLREFRLVKWFGDKEAGGFVRVAAP